jgi:arylsulfatase A-like enzyme
MKPNVLIVVVDSLRADRIWGEQRSCDTPNLDEFRKTAAAFTRTYSVASTTTPCTASILTGTYPLVHGIHSLAGRRLGTELPTLATTFQAGGYRTWAEMTGPLEPVTGLDRGFDEYRCRPYTEWLDTPFGDELTARLRSDSSQPWFGYVHLWEVHYPRRVTPQFQHAKYGDTLYDRAVSSLDAQLGRVFGAVPDDTVVVFTADHGEYLSTSRKNELMTRLKGPAAWAKRNIPGAKRLKRRVMPLVFRGMKSGTPTSTDGYRAWLGHGFHVFESLVHVPLLIRADFVPAGQDVSAMVSHIDLAPTLASELGLDGGMMRAGDVDLGTLATTASAEGRTELYLQASGARRMNRPEQWLSGIRTDRYKYVRGMFNEALPPELYDLERDPAEQENLSTRDPDLRAELDGRLSRLMEKESAAEVEQSPESAYTPEEQAELERRLADLGYMD